MPEIRKGVAAVFRHRPRGGGAHFLATGKGGATLYNGYELGCNFRPPDNHNLHFSSPFSIQLDPFQHQQYLLCKYANTTKCSPSCACVLGFHKHFLKD